MRATGALGLSVAFGLACSGLPAGLPGTEPPPPDPVPEEPAAATPVILGLFRTAGTTCELVAAPFGQEGEDVVVGVLPRECPTDQVVQIAWTEDRVLVGSPSGMWEIVPATRLVTELPPTPDAIQQGLAFNRGVPVACQDLDSTWKEDGDEVVVTANGKDLRSAKVDGAVSYTAARWWKLDPDVWVAGGTEVLPLFENQTTVCDTAKTWPVDHQACPLCDRSNLVWRDPTEAEATALATVGPGVWMVAPGPEDAPLVAAHGTAAEKGPPSLTLPVARPTAGGWTMVKDGTDAVNVETLGDGTFLFQVDGQSWNLVSGGEIIDLGVAVAPFLWPDEVSTELSDEPPVVEEPAPVERDRPVARPVPVRVRDPNKVRPPEGKTGKGKAKAKAKAG